MKHKNFIKITILLSNMLTMMVSSVITPSLPLIKTSFPNIAGIDLLSRLVMTLPALLIAIIAPVSGYIIDKLGRKKVLTVSLICYGISGVSAFFINNIYFILISRAILGISVAGVMTSATTLIGDYFKGDERKKFIGMQGAFIGISGVICMALSGWLADFDWQAPFLLYSITFIIFIFAIIFIYEPELRSQNEAITNSEQHTADYSKPLILYIYILGFLSLAFFFMIPVQVPFLLRSLSSLSNFKIGIAFSISTLSTAAVAINYKRIKDIFSFPNIYAIAFILMGSGYYIIGLSTNYYHYVIGLILGGLSVGLIMPTGSLWILEVAPVEVRGRLVGNMTFFMFMGRFFSPIMLAPIINSYSLPGTFKIAAFALFILSVILIGTSKTH